MSNMKRRSSKQVEAIFSKYVEQYARRVDRDTAIRMLNCEFGLAPEHGALMFDAFDKDKNGVMSMWEFEHFYKCVGNSSINDTVNQFKAWDKNCNGVLEKEEAYNGLKSMHLSDGSQLKDKEIEFFMKTSINDDGVLNIADFANMIFRLKAYEKSPRKM